MLHLLERKLGDKLHEDLTKLLSTIIYTCMYHTGSSVQNLWDTFKTQLFEYLDKNIPSKLIRSKSHLPWINHKIRKMFKKKTRLYHQAYIYVLTLWTKIKCFCRGCDKYQDYLFLKVIHKSIYPYCR